ncbi:MAG: glycosyl hydrolase, partial [Acidobacteriota bacterium]
MYNYRLNDFRPYIYRTDDFGSSWELLTDGRNGIPKNHFVRVVREDPDRSGLLYAGTEFGMFVSFDDGRHWQPFQLNLPVTPITDFAVHRQDLVVATQGRSFWILDDLTPLHQISDAVAAAQAHLHAPRKAYRMQEGGFREPDAPERPPRGVLIYFFLAEKPEKEVALQILDSKNNPIRTFSTKPDEEKKIGKLELSAGMNRFVWDLAYPPADTIRGIQLGLSRTDGPQAPPGAYQVKLTVGEWTQTRSFQVDKDPRWQASGEDLRAQFELAVAVRDKLNEVHDAVRKVRSVREQAKAVAGNAVRAGADAKVRDGADALARKLTEIEETLTQPKSVSSQDTV